MANTHPKPYREGNSGRVKKIKPPHPQSILPVLPHSLHRMVSFHSPDQKPLSSFVSTSTGQNQFTLLSQYLSHSSQPLFQSPSTILSNHLRLSLSLTWIIAITFKENSVAVISFPFQSMCSYNHLSSLAIKFHRSLLFKDKIKLPSLTQKRSTIWDKLIFPAIFPLVDLYPIYYPTIPCPGFPCPCLAHTVHPSLTLSLLARMLLP